MKSITWQRAYDAKDPSSAEHKASYRVLVDRLWPRGIRKEDLVIDYWPKEICPTTKLRERYHHGEIDYDTFAKFYEIELDNNPEAPEFIHQLRTQDKNLIICLYASKDAATSHIPILRAYVEQKLGDDAKN